MNIVVATEELLNEFLKSSHSEHFRYFNTRPTSIIKNHKLTLIGLVNNIPIAYGHIDYETYNWLGICVLDGYQGKGYGKKMMNELIGYADVAGLELYLSVDIDNINAINLYSKYNFIEYKRTDKIIYMKRLIA